jgi:2-polyprenyl-6-hydroxyphenyl methylase / 3-demethylubiquinone-9 3-methyltransferase
MPIDNELYDRMAGSWWDETGFLHILAAFIPPRFGYMRRVLFDELKIDPCGLRTLDIGCGGGLLAEEFARLGCDVSGIDPSGESLAAAARHAEDQGLRIDYRRGTGEAIPFPDAGFDIAYSCDVLEHVADLPRVIAETARILKPGGVFLYDTINRTWRSKLVVIKLFQVWSATSFMPPDLHDWHLFIKPGELLRLLERNGLRNRGMTGLGPAAGPLRIFRILRARKRGELTYVEAARRIDLHESRDTSILYLGHAVKSGA